MTEQAAQEPTMEEILASIRRIISEDEAPAATEAFEVPPAPEPAPVHHAEPEDVLELTERVPEPAAAPAVETLGDLDVMPAAVHREPAPTPPPAAAHAPLAPGEALLSQPAADAASLAFGQLSKTLLMPAEGRTLEDVVRELLRPLLKAWLDEHLPSIVQTVVTEEVERVSRRRV
ncbi:MAG TPA: DUF2497 domain-containing protein [Caulobacteraceae bacterium]|nr:DUF2497 domain-containing protein [Caulobacteraceae bacterium]